MQRPGEMARRLHKLCSMFGPEAAEFFAGVAAQLPTAAFCSCATTSRPINARTLLIHPPRGKWWKGQICARRGERPSCANRPMRCCFAIDGVLSARSAEARPGRNGRPRVSERSESADQVAGDWHTYGRGTRFPVPGGGQPSCGTGVCCRCCEDRARPPPQRLVRQTARSSSPRDCEPARRGCMQPPKSAWCRVLRRFRRTRRMQEGRACQTDRSEPRRSAGPRGTLRHIECARVTTGVRVFRGR